MIESVQARATLSGTRIAGRIRERPSPSAWLQVAIGLLAAALAVGIRYQLPLSPQQLPTLPLVVTLAIVTTFVGVKCGITTAIAGGILSWLVFFNPFSWSVADGSWIPLLGKEGLINMALIHVGLVREPVAWQPDGEEIEKVIEVPWTALSAEGTFRVEMWTREGVDRPVYFFDYQGETIWGATARILKQYLDLVAEPA